MMRAEPKGPTMDRVVDALRTILPLAGWGEERARAVEMTGGADATAYQAK
jgi:hypothetical protein